MRLIRLLAISILAGIFWRAEIEIRWGWASLDWIGAFHWAFPVIALMYLAWMVLELQGLAPKRLQIMLCIVSLLGIIAYFGGSAAMSLAYSRWIGLLAPWHTILLSAAPVIVYSFLGLAYFTATARLASPSIAGLVTGVALYALAFPLAILLLWITNHRGYPDPIDAIKSGFVFPIILFAFGLPIIHRNTHSATRPNNDRSSSGKSA